eukprot:m.57520 g.57520  ORF g.57520 m.57520 type:complete len:608 (-) comp12752_c1_seq1:118-1941(-)
MRVFCMAIVVVMFAAACQTATPATPAPTTNPAEVGAIEARDGDVSVMAPRHVELEGDDVVVKIRGGDPIKMSDLLSTVNKLVSDVADLKAFKANLAAVACDVTDSVHTINTDGTAQCARTKPVTGSCSAGNVVTGINDVTGEVECSTYTVQQLVSESCAAGQSIRKITETGTVECEDDDDTKYSPDFSVVQARITGQCSDTQTVTSVDVNGAPVCSNALKGITDNLATWSVGNETRLTELSDTVATQGGDLLVVTSSASGLTTWRDNFVVSYGSDVGALQQEDINTAGTIDSIEDQLLTIEQAINAGKDCGTNGQVHGNDGCVDVRVADTFCPTLGLPIHGHSSHVGVAAPGTSATFSCEDGYYLDGASSSSCLDTLTWSNALPTCRACPDGCSKCSNANTCTACDASLQLSGGNCKPIFVSCQEGVSIGAIPFETGVRTLNVANDPSRTVEALCFVHTDGKIYTNIACDALNTAGCKTTSRTTDDNTCKDFGMVITPYRSKAHFQALINKWGASDHYFTAVSGLSKPTDGGSFTSCVMQSKNSHCNQWQATDGGEWWLSDKTYTEPNGDYDANCYLDHWSHDPDNMEFNDASCAISTSRYICISYD